MFFTKGFLSFFFLANLLQFDVVVSQSDDVAGVLYRQEHHLLNITGLLIQVLANQKEEHPVPKKCTSPFEVHHEKCLFLNLNAKTSWKEARTECQAKDGDLVSIEDGLVFQHILEYVRSRMINYKDDSIWIGGTDEAAEDTWTWVNGVPMKMGAPFWHVITSNYSQPDNGNGFKAENYAELCAQVGFYIDDVEDSTPNFGLCEQSA